MKHNRNLFRTAFSLCTALTMTITPVLAQESGVPESEIPVSSSEGSENSQTSAADSQVTSDTEDSRNFEPSEDGSQSADSDQNGLDAATPNTPLPSEENGEPADTASDPNGPDTQVTPEIGQDKNDILIDKPSYDDKTGKLTCSLTINTVPENLAYQLNWSSNGPAIDAKSAEVKIDGETVKLEPKELVDEKTKEAERPYEGYLKFSFTKDLIQKMKDGSVITFVFQAIPSNEGDGAHSGDQLNFNQCVYTGSKIAADTSLLDDSEDPGEVLSTKTGENGKDDTIKVVQDQVVSWEYQPENDIWQMTVEMKTRPKSLSVSLSSSPDVLNYDKTAVTADGKAVDLKTDPETETASKVYTIELPEETVEGLTDKSVVKFDFPVQADPSTDVSIDAEVDNGEHTVLYNAQFTTKNDASFKPSYDFDKQDQAFVVKLAFNKKPVSPLVLTFTQPGDYIRKPSSVKLEKGGVTSALSPEITETTDGGFNKYVVNFPESDLEKIGKDSKVILTFPVTSSKERNATVLMNIKEGTYTKNLKANFKIEPRTSTGSTNSVSTSANTGMIAALAALVIAAAGAVFFFIKSRRAGKNQ